MKRFLTFIIALCLSTYSQAQTIEKFSISSGGQSVSNGNIDILYTIGEVNVQELNVGGISVSEGFIGSDFNSNTLSIATFEEDNIIVYPNPALNFIHIKTNLSLEKIELYDVLGKQVLKMKYINKIRVNELSKGVYILKVYSINKKYSKKIIIQ